MTLARKPSPSNSLLDTALGLSREQRAKLADALVSSLQHESPPGVAAAWATEAESRVDALDSGALCTTDAGIVLARHMAK